MYREIKHYFGKPENNINSYVDELLNFSKFYSMFNDASESSTKVWLVDNEIYFHEIQYNVQEITRVIQALKLFRASTCSSDNALLYNTISSTDPSRDSQGYPYLLPITRGRLNGDKL